MQMQISERELFEMIGRLTIENQLLRAQLAALSGEMQQQPEPVNGNGPRQPVGAEVKSESESEPA